MSQELNTFAVMCEAVGEDATEAQIARLTSWALENLGTGLYKTAGEIALQMGVTALYTEFSMRAGECGL